MELDESKLLLSFVDPPDVTDLRDGLAQLAISLEGDDEDGAREPLLHGRACVNHTSHRFWVRAAAGDQLRAQEVYRAFGESLDWVGPVYRLGEPGPLQELVCTPPDALHITLSDHWDVVEQNGELPPALRQVDMTEIPESSKYLRGRYFRLTRPRETPAYEVRRELLAAESRFIEDVDLEYMPLHPPYTFIPTDPRYAIGVGQWNMRIIKAGGTGTTGWDFSTGDPSIVVAVLDCGCERDHPDLKPNMQAGVRLDNMTSPGDPTILPGPPVTPCAQFAAGHGTWVAGIIGAQINNGQGVAGLAGGVAGVPPGGCQIMPLAFVTGCDTEVAQGIRFAADHGARVLNMSFGNPAYNTPEVNAAIDYAFGKNMVLCAATGNDNLNHIAFPASHPHVIACGGSDEYDKRYGDTIPRKPDGSNYGAGLSVAAPDRRENGTGIPTTDVGHSYTFFFGTSAAAPHVAGLAALILSINPHLSNVYVREIIEDSADNVGGYLYLPLVSALLGGPYRYRSRELGFGRINVARALASVPPPLVGPFKPKSLKSEVKEIEYPIPPIPPKSLEVPNGVWPGVDLLALHQNLVQRVDQLEEMVQGRSFIRAEDRPEMGLPSESPDEEADVHHPPPTSEQADIQGGAAEPETH